MHLGQSLQCSRYTVTIYSTKSSWTLADKCHDKMKHDFAWLRYGIIKCVPRYTRRHPTRKSTSDPTSCDHEIHILLWSSLSCGRIYPALSDIYSHVIFPVHYPDAVFSNIHPHIEHAFPGDTTASCLGSKITNPGYNQDQLPPTALFFAGRRFPLHH
jgi:hypothetical protein